MKVAQKQGSLTHRIEVKDAVPLCAQNEYRLSQKYISLYVRR
jgi:hypothetical protein